MKKIHLIKIIAATTVVLFATSYTASAQRRDGGGGGSRSGGSIPHISAPPSSGGGNVRSIAPSPSEGRGHLVAPSPAPSSGGAPRLMPGGNPSHYTINGGNTGVQYNGNAVNNRGGNVHSVAPNLGYRSNRGYETRGGYHRGGANYYGYGYRGYDLGIFSPYALYPFYPTLGLRLGFLPCGYYSFYYDGYPYYYYNSVFYRRTEDNYYEIIAPPLGAKVTSIPDNSKEVVVNGKRYYESNGTYYEQQSDENGRVVYVVVGTDGVLNQPEAPQVVYEPQVGDIVPQLPSNCSTVFLNGQKYHESPDNVYYQEVQDGDKTTYKIVGK